MSSLELSKNEMNSIKPHFTSLILFLSLLVQLYQTLETDQAVIDGKYNVLAQNLTAEELEFLHKVVNYDTEVNLRYLILNKTQEMYAQNYAQMYKQAEDQIVFHEDHLKIKYYHYFVRHQQFEMIYYPLVEKFFFKVLRFVPQEVKRMSRFVYHPELGHYRQEFLENEELIDKRINIIRNIFDDALKSHYVLTDDLDVLNFVNNSRAKIDDFFQSKQYFQVLREMNITLVKDIAAKEKNRTRVSSQIRQATVVSLLN